MTGKAGSREECELVSFTVWNIVRISSLATEKRWIRDGRARSCGKFSEEVQNQLKHSPPPLLAALGGPRYSAQQHTNRLICSGRPQSSLKRLINLDFFPFQIMPAVLTPYIDANGVQKLKVASECVQIYYIFILISDCRQ